MTVDVHDCCVMSTACIRLDEELHKKIIIKLYLENACRLASLSLLFRVYAMHRYSAISLPVMIFNRINKMLVAKRFYHL